MSKTRAPIIPRHLTPPNYTGEELNLIRKNLGLDEVEMGFLIGAETAAISDYESNKIPIPLMMKWAIQAIHARCVGWVFAIHEKETSP